MDNGPNDGEIYQGETVRRAAPSAFTIHRSSQAARREAATREVALTEGKRPVRKAHRVRTQQRRPRVARMGFEPMTSSLKGKRPRPLGDRALHQVCHE